MTKRDRTAFETKLIAAEEKVAKAMSELMTLMEEQYRAEGETKRDAEGMALQDLVVFTTREALTAMILVVLKRPDAKAGESIEALVKEYLHLSYNNALDEVEESVPKDIAEVGDQMLSLFGKHGDRVS